MYSKTGQLSSYDFKSLLIYAGIMAISLFIPLLPDVEAWMIVKGINPLVAGYVITLVWFILKKILTDYSKHV